MGKTAVIAAGIVILLALTFIFCFDLPGGSQVGGGPMTKYKIIMTHFQVSTRPSPPSPELPCYA